jgi:hypothetical protein
VVDGVEAKETEYRPYHSATFVMTQEDPKHRRGSGEVVASRASWEDWVVFDSPTKFRTYATKNSKVELLGSKGGEIVRVEAEIAPTSE